MTVMSSRSNGHQLVQGDNGSKNFFPEAIETAEGSLALMKKLTAISISTILYYRNMFPEHDYGIRVHEGDIWHLLDTECQSPEAKEVISAVRSLFDPIQKKFLKQVILGFIEDPNLPGDFVEAYVFKFKYSRDAENGTLSVSQ